MNKIFMYLNFITVPINTAYAVNNSSASSAFAAAFCLCVGIICATDYIIESMRKVK